MIDALTLRGLEDPDFGGNQPSLGSWSKTVSPNFAQNRSAPLSGIESAYARTGVVFSRLTQKRCGAPRSLGKVVVTKIVLQPNLRYNL